MINATEEAWIRGNVAAAPALVAYLTNTELTRTLSVAQLDAAWAAWLLTADPDTEHVHQLLNILGLSFGQILVDRLQLEWAVASDGDGTEMAVVGPAGELVAYPRTAVTNRWEARETNFFAPLLEMYVDTLRRSRRTP